MKKYISKQKTVLTLASVLALTAVFASCEKKEETQTQPEDEDSELTVNVAEGESVVSLTEGTTLDLFAINSDGTALAKATATVGQGGSLIGTESILTVMTDGVQLAASSPSGLWSLENCTQPLQFSVPADQSSVSAYQSADLMMAPVTSVADGSAALVMSHVMTKITVHVTDVTGNYDLSKAGLVMPGLKNAVTADLFQHTVTTVDASAGDIIPYSPTNTPYRASASAIVAPVQMAAGATLLRVSVDDETFTYPLQEDSEWQSGKEYVYNIRLTDEGLVPFGNYVTDWDSADGELSGDFEGDYPEVTPPDPSPSSYGVGDYLLSNGNFVKADQITSDQVLSVVAVVFSTEVSTTDAAAGYNAYAMGIQRVSGKKYGLADPIGENVTDFSKAFSDLDGRSKTQLMMESEAYKAIADKASVVFGALEAYGASYQLPSAVASGWFVPSFGQMMQVLNNLGAAGLTADMEVPNNFSSPMYQSADNSVFNKINSFVAKVGSDVFPTSGDTVFATSTEFSNNFWCVQTLTENGVWNWAFGRNARRASNMGRSVLPCTAVKLP